MKFQNNAVNDMKEILSNGVIKFIMKVHIICYIQKWVQSFGHGT